MLFRSKEKTREIRQELNDFRDQLANQLKLDEEAKISRKMEKLREKQGKKKEKKQPAAGENKPAQVKAPAVKPIAKGDTVRIKGQTSVGEVLDINGKNGHLGNVEVLFCSKYE